MSYAVVIDASTFNNIIGHTAVIIDISTEKKSLITNCIFINCKTFDSSSTGCVYNVKGKLSLSKTCFRNCSAYQQPATLSIFDSSNVERASSVYCIDETDDVVCFSDHSNSKLDQSNFSSNIAQSSSFVQVLRFSNFIFSYSIGVNNSGTFSIQIFEANDIELDNMLIAHEKISAHSIYVQDIAGGYLRLKKTIFGDSGGVPIFQGTGGMTVSFQDCFAYRQAVGISGAKGITQVNEGEIPATLSGCGVQMNGCNFHETKHKACCNPMMLLSIVVASLIS